MSLSVMLRRKAYSTQRHQVRFVAGLLDAEKNVPPVPMMPSSYTTACFAESSQQRHLSPEGRGGEGIACCTSRCNRIHQSILVDRADHSGSDEKRRVYASTLHDITSGHTLSREYVPGIYDKRSMSSNQGVIDRVVVGHYHRGVIGVEHRAIKSDRLTTG